MAEEQKWHMNDVLHIYGPEAHHDTVHILGTPDTLRALGKAIRVALKRQSAKLDGVYVNDGEGFEVHIARIDDTKTAQAIMLPYTIDYATDKRDDCIKPWALLLPKA